MGLKELNESIKGNDSFLDAFLCTACSTCGSAIIDRDICSLRKKYLGVEAGPRGVNWIIQAIFEDRLEVSDDLVDFFYCCTTCNFCHFVCPTGIVNPKKYIEEFRKDAIEAGVAPKQIKDVLDNSAKYGNKWGKPQNKRAEWAKDIDIKTVNEIEDFEYLLFVDDASSYVPENQETAKALTYILNKTGIKYAWLGNEAKDSGQTVFALGETGLFEELAKFNIDKFKKYGVKRIIALSPHTFHVLKYEYPKIDSTLDIEVIHHTTFLYNLLQEGKIDLKNNVELSVAYHDPCYLSRHLSAYKDEDLPDEPNLEAFEPALSQRLIDKKTTSDPRDVLRSIRGLKYNEISLSIISKAYNLCCGGGGGGLWVDKENGIRPEENILADAKKLNVDTLITSCPFCKQMFLSGKENMGIVIDIKDIAEIVKDAIE